MGNELAVIIGLWIGEIKPDTFSFYIQLFLTLRKKRGVKYALKALWEVVILRKALVNFSHNAFIKKDTGRVWHGTISDNPKYTGFCDEDLTSVLKGSVVRACKEIQLNITYDQLEMYLEGRRGTPYSQRQNLAAILPVLTKVPILKRAFITGKLAINCSEVLAEICTKFSDYKFTDLDLVKPTDTYRVLKPDLCGHDHIVLITKVS